MRWDAGDVAAPGFLRSAFRLQQFTDYGGEADPDFRRWLQGAPERDWDGTNGWAELLRSECELGLRISRIKVVSPQLTEYERYLCHWQFTSSIRAGEDVRIVDMAEQDLPTGMVDHDFWLLDDERVLRLHYDARGRLMSAEPASPSSVHRYLGLCDALHSIAEPFGSWWARVSGVPLSRFGLLARSSTDTRIRQTLPSRFRDA